MVINRNAYGKEIDTYTGAVFLMEEGAGDNTGEAEDCTPDWYPNL